MKHFDLFSGYGAFTLALQKIYETKNNFRFTADKQSTKKSVRHQSNQSISSGGMGNGRGKYSNDNRCETIGFSEIDKYASAVFEYHWPNTKNYGDITKINWDKVPDFDLLTGGSPCQDLSIAGKRAGLDGSRSGLFWEFMRAVREKKPRYFIWENVKGALSSNKGLDFAAVLNEMAEAGYSLWWQVLNAKDFGVPQNRERIFVVGFRDEPSREIFFEREDSPKDNVIPTLTTRYYSGQANGAYIGDKKNKIKQLNNPTHSNNRLYSDDGISPALNTAQGGNRQPKILSDILERKKDSLGRNMPIHRAIGKSRIRRLTPIECERLMGLPDNWTKLGIIDVPFFTSGKGIHQNYKIVEISDSQRYKLCGNGVVVNVVEEIIKKLILQI